MTRPQLVIFDCDGVLVDSEPISVAVLLEMISGAGGRVGEEEAYRRFLGRSMATVAEILRSDFRVAGGGGPGGPQRGGGVSGAS